jgi:hypothetical protein
VPINDALLNKIIELNAGIIIRPANADDALPFIELMNKYVLRKKNTDYFYWQYINAVNPTALFMAYDRDILAGYCGVKIQPLSNSYLCGFIIDLIIHENYRNRALFFLLERAIHEFALNNLAVAVASLPNHKGMIAHKNLEGWNNLCQVFELIVRPRVACAIAQNKSKTPKELISFKKDDRYRNWRYARHPEYKYTYIKLKSGEFAITKIFADPVTGERFGDIVDFECALNNAEILGELFLRAVLEFKEQGLDNVTAWALPHTDLYSALKSIGFKEVPKERYFCVKVIEPKYEYLYDLASWHLVQADSEIY